MTSLFLSKEMAMSLRAIFDLAFAASLLTLRWIVVLIAEARVTRNLMFRKATRVRFRVFCVDDSPLAAIDAENVS
jgi:hypothetical protein